MAISSIGRFEVLTTTGVDFNVSDFLSVPDLGIAVRVNRQFKALMDENKRWVETARLLKLPLTEDQRKSAKQYAIPLYSIKMLYPTVQATILKCLRVCEPEAKLIAEPDPFKAKESLDKFIINGKHTLVPIRGARGHSTDDDNLVTRSYNLFKEVLQEIYRKETLTKEDIKTLKMFFGYDVIQENNLEDIVSIIQYPLIDGENPNPEVVKLVLDELRKKNFNLQQIPQFLWPNVHYRYITAEFGARGAACQAEWIKVGKKPSFQELLFAVGAFFLDDPIQDQAILRTMSGCYQYAPASKASLLKALNDCQPIIKDMILARRGILICKKIHPFFQRIVDTKTSNVMFRVEEGSYVSSFYSALTKKKVLKSTPVKYPYMSPYAFMNAAFVTNPWKLTQASNNDLRKFLAGFAATEAEIEPLLKSLPTLEEVEKEFHAAYEVVKGILLNLKEAPPKAASAAAKK